MIVHCLGTGSSGNCYIVEYEPHKAFMLDCGLPSKMVIQYCEKNNLLGAIQFCLISHLHIDHLHDFTFINNFSVKTYFPIKDLNNEPQNRIKPELKNYCNEMTQTSFFADSEQKIKVEFFQVPHDAINYGYRITLPSGKNLVYITDCGNIIKNEQHDWPRVFNKVNLYMVECNYDDETIAKEDSVISRRSKSPTGHCSSKDCFEYLNLQFNLNKSNILLVHKSSERFNDLIGYKQFRDLDCKDCRPIKFKTSNSDLSEADLETFMTYGYNFGYKYIYDDQMNLVDIIDENNNKVNLLRDKLNKE